MYPAFEFSSGIVRKVEGQRDINLHIPRISLRFIEATRLAAVCSPDERQSNPGLSHLGGKMPPFNRQVFT
jgi:hypothetical protein